MRASDPESRDDCERNRQLIKLWLADVLVCQQTLVHEDVHQPHRRSDRTPFCHHRSVTIYCVGAYGNTPSEGTGQIGMFILLNKR